MPIHAVDETLSARTGAHSQHNARPASAADGPVVRRQGCRTIDPMFNAIVLFIHLLAAVLFIGPQIFLVAAGVPAARTVQDLKQRATAVRMMTGRFGWIGGGALVVLLITGVINYMHSSDNGDLDFKRFFIVLQIKLTLVAVVVVGTLLHGAVFGRRLQALQESNASEAEIAGVRRWSGLMSMLTLGASIVILFLAALLGSDWSTSGGLR